MSIGFQDVKYSVRLDRTQLARGFAKVVETGTNFLPDNCRQLINPSRIEPCVLIAKTLSGTRILRAAQWGLQLGNAGRQHWCINWQREHVGQVKDLIRGQRRARPWWLTSVEESRFVNGAMERRSRCLGARKWWPGS